MELKPSCSNRHGGLALVLTLALGLSLGLAGCGGGGGDGGTSTIDFPQARAGTPSASADLTGANADAISAAAVRALLSDLLDGDTLTAAGPADGAASVARALAHAAAPGLAAARGGAGGREHAQVVVSSALPCISGSGTASGNVANLQTFTPGDTISATLQDCVIDPSLPAASGRFTQRYDAVEIRGGTIVGLAVTMSMESLEIAGLPALTGTMDLYFRANSDGSERNFTRYRAVQARTGADVQVLDWDVDETLLANGRSTSSLSGQVTVGGQTFAVQQLAVFEFLAGATFPSSGAFRIVDAGGDSVRVSVGLTQVLRDFLPVGGSAVALPTQDWAAFRQ